MLTIEEDSDRGIRLAPGYRSNEVAKALGINVQTVETHLRNIYDKLHVRSRAGAVARFLTREK